MDQQQREHIHDDLRGLLEGELLFDPLSLALYSTDASIFQVQPAGIVVPRHEDDVRALVRYAVANRLALIPRGGGSGLAGEALGQGLIVDLSKHFRAILAIGTDTIRVQPGVTCRAVNTELAKIGRRFAPDPASADQATIGGMLATNASGARVLRYGYTREHVASLRFVFDSGDVATLGQDNIQDIALDRSDHVQDIFTALQLLLAENAELIRSHQPRTPFNRCGYLLDGTLHGDVIDFPRLLIGSEGTLGIFTEATLRTLPLAGGRALVLAGFASLDAAVRAVQLVLPTQPSACDLLERRLLSLARGSDASEVAGAIPTAVEAVLLIEYETDNAPAASTAAQRAVQLLTRGERLALWTTAADVPAEIERLWRLREVALPSLYNMQPGAMPVTMIEDVGVPLAELSTYLVRVQDILQEHETTASFLIHAGSGQVHTRPFLDLRQPRDVSLLAEIAEKVHAVALELGGTVSTQHGTGIARTPWVARQYGSLYPVLRQVKAIFDPLNIFNPGKIVNPKPRWARWPLRTMPSDAVPTPPLLLQWRPEEARLESSKCNGCGQCRQEGPAQRMCPIFHADHSEAASPRAKANLLRHLLTVQESPSLSASEVRAVADLCVNCKMCAVECPAHVNVPKLMLEVKAAHVARHGLDRKDWFLARAEDFAHWGSSLAPLVNLGLGSTSVRWLLEKFFGLSRRRRLPPMASQTFLQLAQRRGWTRRPRSERPKVAYFVDTYANYIDPLIGEATVALLRAHGFQVHVPPGQRVSGAPALTYGDVETARELARANVNAFAEAARAGWPIVCSEPTAALMLRQDYLDLLDDDDARQVAERTVELTTFLGQLHQQGRLRTDLLRPLPLSVGHHIPCHLKALGRAAAGPDLLALIPQMHVHTIDVSCSGMAGTFGLSAKHHETSLAAGRAMLDELRRPTIQYGATECSSCRLQMEDAAHKRTLHPAQYLALAFGLMPELAARLTEPIGDLLLR